MNTTIDALKALYVALGGELTDTYDNICNGATVSNYVIIPDCINAIAAIAAGKTLPTISTDDNGKVLTVTGGEWVAADAPEELPEVTSDDNGKVLTVVDGEWSAAEA